MERRQIRIETPTLSYRGYLNYPGKCHNHSCGVAGSSLAARFTEGLREVHHVSVWQWSSAWCLVRNNGRFHESTNPRMCTMTGFFWVSLVAFTSIFVLLLATHRGWRRLAYQTSTEPDCLFACCRFSAVQLLCGTNLFRRAHDKLLQIFSWTFAREYLIEDYPQNVP